MAAWKLSFEEEIKELLDVQDDVDLPIRSDGLGGRGGIRNRSRNSLRRPSELRTIPEFREDSGMNASSTPAGVSGATAGGGRKPGRGLGRGQRIRARALKREQDEVVFGGCGHLITSEIAQLAISETASTSSDRRHKPSIHTHWCCNARKGIYVYVRSILSYTRILTHIDSIHMCVKAFVRIRPLTASK